MLHGSLSYIGYMYSERGVMVPVPKKESRGTDACTRDDFRGISVVSAAYKAMCKIVKVRLKEFVERRQLLAEKQGGIRKGRGCRDQMVTLHLLWQIRMITRRGVILHHLLTSIKHTID